MRKIFLFAFVLFFFFESKAQADFIELGNRQYSFLDRLEIMLQKDSVFNFSFIKPYDRQTITKRLEYVDSLVKSGKLTLSKVDKYNLEMALKNNFEWRSNLIGKDTSLKFKNLWGSEHKNNPFYFGVKRGDFSFYSHLMYNFETGKETDRNTRLYHNTRGLFQWRGQFSKKLGYYTYATDNQFKLPLHARQFVDANTAIPGLGYFKGDKSVNNTAPFDLFEVKGGIMLNVSKGIDMQFAMDKVFMGNGYRSLILSDFSNNFLFLKINTRFWKINYYNLYGQMVNRSEIPFPYDTLFPKKFITMHCLDIQATKWLNIGFFENIVFGRQNGKYDMAYLNPMIFTVGLGHQLGSPDKATIGMNIKANIAKKHQVYSQIIINEFVGKEIVNYNNGFWANKQAIQLGVKSIDVLGIKNFDIQAEVNIVRPFVYTSKDNFSSFTHYNQALAHPLGANFKEFIGIVRYQPIPKIVLQAKAIYFEQGTDSAGVNMGSNILTSYFTRPRDYGWFVGSGIKSKTLLAHLSVTYELMPNIFIDADYVHRSNKLGDNNLTSNSIFNIGFRMNIRKRQYDF